MRDFFEKLNKIASYSLKLATVKSFPNSYVIFLKDFLLKVPHIQLYYYLPAFQQLLFLYSTIVLLATLYTGYLSNRVDEKV